MADSVRGGSAKREGERGKERRERERERVSVTHQIKEYTNLPLLAVAVCAESADSGSSKISGCSSSVVVAVGSSSVGVASSEDGVSYNQNTIIILFQLLLVQKIRIKWQTLMIIFLLTVQVHVYTRTLLFVVFEAVELLVALEVAFFARGGGWLLSLLSR